MKRILEWIKWGSPWAALGLAAALVAVTLRPGLLDTARDTPPVPAPTAAPAVTEPTADAAPVSEQPAVAAPVQQLPDYADAVERSAPAVVNVYTERVVRVPGVRNLPTELAPFFGEMWGSYRERVERSLGSGVVYDGTGHVVTNHHVVEGATQISVQLRDGRVAPARLVGSDRDTDLAVLSVGLERLPRIALGRSDRLRVGEPVLAIGNPLGLGQTVTQGIVSATGRGRLGVATFENFIQTDAAINFGNSGGALINARGELVGINTAVFSRNVGIEGIGFAIPVDLVRGVVDAIVRDGRVVRGWIGIRPRSLSSEESRQFGYPDGAVVVTAIYRGTPAAAEGMQPGDVITKVDGEAVHGAEDLLTRIAARAPGQVTRLTVHRGPPFEGQPREHSVRIEVIERPPLAATGPSS